MATISKLHTFAYSHFLLFFLFSCNCWCYLLRHRFPGNSNHFNKNNISQFRGNTCLGGKRIRIGKCQYWPKMYKNKEYKNEKNIHNLEYLIAGGYVACCFLTDFRTKIHPQTQTHCSSTL